MSITYNLLLRDRRWKDKRLVILKRDGYKCRKCNCRDNLQIHHKIYVDGRAPWEYTNQFLITLCDSCHEKEHQKKDIKDFIEKNKKVIEHSNPNKSKNKKKKPIKKYRPSKSNTSWFDW